MKAISLPVVDSASDDADLDIQLVREAARWFDIKAALREGRQIPDRVRWEELVNEVSARSFEMPDAWTLYRARVMPIANEDDADPLHHGIMGPPPASEAKAGRLNIGGSPCFYGARDPMTALAEVRPWRRARVTIVECHIDGPLTMVDLSGSVVVAPMSPAIDWLGFVLQRPVHPDDAESYLPSQAVAAECSRRGIAGLVYRSALHPSGTNVALFESHRVRYGRRAMYEVMGIEYATIQVSAWSDA